MSSNVLSTRLPWQDRWAQPTLLQLLEPLKIQHRRLFEQLMAELANFDQVDQAILWYGSAWNWTIQYQLRTEALAPEIREAASHDPSDDPQTLVYLVPRVETPIICIPLSDQMIQQLPMKRLNRFIRDGIKNAKCAVAIHWATWTPNSKAEVGFLADLLKRKCKLLMGGPVRAEKMDVEGEEVKPKGRGRKGKKAAAAPVTLEQDAGQAVEVEHPPKTQKGKGAAKTTKSAKADKPAKVVKKTTKAAGKAKTAKSAKSGKSAKSASKQKVAAVAKPAKSVKSAKPVKTVKVAKDAKPSKSVKTGKAVKAAAGKGKAKTFASKTASKTAGKAKGKVASKSTKKTTKKSTKKTTKKVTKKVTRPASKTAAKTASKSTMKKSTANGASKSKAAAGSKRKR